MRCTAGGFESLDQGLRVEAAFPPTPGEGLPRRSPSRRCGVCGLAKSCESLISSASSVERPYSEQSSWYYPRYTLSGFAQSNAVTLVIAHCAPIISTIDAIRLRGITQQNLQRSAPRSDRDYTLSGRI